MVNCAADNIPPTIPGYHVNSIGFYLDTAKRISLTNYVVLAMIGTIGDMVPLIGDNRLIVDKGLELLYQTDIIGLQYILNEVFKFEYPKSSDVAFQLVPLINSAGRMNQSYKIIELFSSNDLSVTAKVEELLQINKERKSILEKDLAKIKTNNDLDYNFIYDQSLFFGTIGIIANKLLNESNKVTFVLTKVGDEIKGSARSNQVDLKKFINENKDCFHKAGGHFSAIGFTLNNNLSLTTIEDRLDLFIKSYKKTEKNTPYIELDLAKIDSNFIKQLYILEPFGQGFEAPFVKIGSITNFKEMKIFKDTHIKIQVSDLVEILYFFANKEIYDKLKKAIENNKKYEIYGKIQSTGEKTIILVEKISFE
jgi:single-stranded-DNA-specific exonuclease